MLLVPDQAPISLSAAAGPVPSGINPANNRRVQPETGNRRYLFQRLTRLSLSAIATHKAMRQTSLQRTRRGDGVNVMLTADRAGAIGILESRC